MRTAKPLLLFCALSVLLVLPLLAQGDSTAVVPPADPNAAFVLGLAGLAAFIAQAIGSWLVAKWNAVGGWLETIGNGMKRVIAVALTGALGLAANALASLLTHNTNWLATVGLSIVAGVISTLTAGMAIDTAKAKMAADMRVASAHRV